MKLNISKKSLFFKVAAILLAAGLLELMLFMTWENTVATLKGDVVVMNMVGSERMRLLKITLLAEHYAEGVEQDFGTKVMLDNEINLFEGILFGLRDGNPRYNLKKEDSPAIIAKLNQNIDKWNKSVKPMLISTFNKGGIKGGLKDYNREEVFTYLDDINGLATLFERHSEENINRLRQLQIVFLFLSGLIALGSLILLYTVIIRPIKKLGRAVTAMASGDLSQTVPVLSGDEIGELGTGFNNMAAQIRMHIDSIDNKMTSQLNSHIDTLNKKIIEINEQEQRYEGLVNNLNVGVYRRMADGQLIEVNQAAVAMFEAGSKEELAKYNVAALYKDKNKMKEVTDKLLKYGSVKDEEVECLTVKGRAFWCTLNAVAKKDTDGNAYIDGIVENITKKRNLEEQARHSQKMEAIGELAAGAAHEINNPLASMAVCAESLIKRLKPGSFKEKDDYERFISYMRIIEDEIYRSKDITVALLDFSREKSLALHNVNINVLLDETIKLIQLQRKYSAFIVRTNTEDGLPDISANEGQIRQVFLAIMKNAFEAMRSGGLLNIRTANDIDEGAPIVKVIFKDNGCGISEENLNRIFEAFFTTKGHAGTGLGLSVCYSIMKQHGGRIEVKSEEGMGSTFTVVLPVTPPQKMLGKTNGYSDSMKNKLKIEN